MLNSSEMSRLTEFLHVVLEDLGTWCRTSTTHDVKTVMRRLEHEGVGFLTIRLAKFGKDLEKGLDQGFIAHDQFAGFSRTGGLPRFLGGFLELVFSRETGVLLHDPSITAIWAIRQFTLMWAKMNLECTPAREAAAFNKFVECEQDVRDAQETVSPARVDRFLTLGRLLWAGVFCGIDSDVAEGNILPKHGPGHTADRLSGNAKWSQAEWTERLDAVFPHWEHLVVGWSQFDRLANVRILEPGAERPVRVVAVPKTHSTPRIIAIEPACMQYMQQGLLASFEKHLRRDDFLLGLVGNQSQVPNQQLALEGSRNGTLATLDLSEASDRVGYQHVRDLLRNHRFFAEAVDASRSRKADVPGHGVIRLAKFASMGSALTFPIESVVFATLVFVGIEEALKTRLSRADMKSYSGQVRVYGDDIIVPAEFVHSVTAVLEDFGLRVNVGKSFWTGKFRESCGKEYYDGEDVSIVRLRTSLPSSLTDVQEIISCTSTRNQAYYAGLWKTARYLDDTLSRLIPWPRVSERSPVLGRQSMLGPDMSGPMCSNLHVPLVKGYVVVDRSPISRLDDYGALRKCLTRLETLGSVSSRSIWEMPSPDVEHLERSGRSQRVNLKLRRVPAA